MILEGRELLTASKNQENYSFPLCDYYEYTSGIGPPSSQGVGRAGRARRRPCGALPPQGNVLAGVQRPWRRLWRRRIARRGRASSARVARSPEPLRALGDGSELAILVQNSEKP